MQGERLGPYLIDRELGSGAMGTVYEAHDDDGNRVAVKLVHPHLISTEGFARRFLREAEIGQRIDHPNVVRTLAAGEHEGRPYIALEYVLGGTLHDLLMDLHRVPETLCRHIGREAANGLGAIHARGIVHRDIKPENILITPDHEVRLMDLGLARAASGADRLTLTGHFAGTPAYCPPEQFHGLGELDVRSDLYSLGATLYELATGQPPFAADSLPALVRMVMDETPPRPGQLCTQLSPFFEEVLLALLEKDPARRIPTAEKLARVLEAGERSDWWSVQATVIVEQTRRPLRRIRIPRETECVGRDDDLAALRAAFDAAKDGDGRVILLEGEAGIGKSRLIDELMRRLEAAGEDVNFLFGSYPPGGGATAVGAFSTAYGEQFGNEGCARYLTETPVLAPAFDALLRGDATPPGAHPLTSDSLKTVLVHATRALGRERPTVVVIDDLHFAPDEGRELFASLAAAVPGHPILLVGTARPGLPKEWYANLERLDHVSRSQVTRLGPDDVSQLLEPVIGASLQAERLATSIAATADGNPFFLFEIVRSLRESGILTKADDGSWATTSRISEIALPDTVQSLLDARIDRLSDEERELLECAACWGFEFDGRLVAEALGMRRLPALRLLGRLEQDHGLVRAAGSAFAFDHHAIQEHLYARLPGAMREELHAALAEALEKRSDAADQDPETLDGVLCVNLFEHFVRGSMERNALRYLEAAHEHLARHYLHATSAALIEHLLAGTQRLSDTERARGLLSLADAVGFGGDQERRLALVEEACTLSDRAGDPKLRQRAAESLGTANSWMRRSAEAEAAWRGAAELARECGDRRAEAVALLNISGKLRSRGQLAEARRLVDDSRAISRELSDRELESTVLEHTTFLTILELGWSEAREIVQRCLERARELGRRDLEAAATDWLFTIAGMEGRIDAALELARQGIELDRQCGNRPVEARNRRHRGLMLWAHLGRVDEAREQIERALQISREIGQRRGEAAAHRMLGRIALEAEDYASAQRHLSLSLEMSERMRDPLHVAETRLYLGTMRLALEDPVGAQDLLELALEPLEAAGDWQKSTATLYQLACLPGGDVVRALAALEECVERLPAHAQAEAWWYRWNLTGNRADLAEAKHRLDDALATVPAAYHDAMLSNLSVNRGIMAAWREEFGDEDRVVSSAPNAPPQTE